MTLLTLQEVSDRTGVSVRSLRYYIDRGWLPKPEPRRREGRGRPAGRIPSTCLGQVQLIRRVIDPAASESLSAVPLGVYIYEDGGERVELEIVAREEVGPYVLLKLKNGDFILRKKGAVK